MAGLTWARSNPVGTVGAIGSLASIAAFFGLEAPGSIAIGVTSVTVGWIGRSMAPRWILPHTRLFRDTRSIQIFMNELLGSDQSAAVFTRDGSWVDNATSDMLERKAASNALYWYQPAETALSRRLAAAGATVHYYGRNVTIRSRFSILDPDRHATVYVGYGQVGRRWRVTHYEPSDDEPAHLLARDLRHALEALSDRGKPL